MASLDEISWLREDAQSTQFYILFRIPDEELDANADMKKLAFLDQEVIKCKFAPYLDYKAIDKEIFEIRKKYQALPDLRFAQAKVEAMQMQYHSSSLPCQR